MKNRVNSVSVFIPNIPLVDTVYPVTVINDDGSESLTYQTIPDEDITTLMYEDVSLNALKRAGIDPSTLGSPKTSSYTRINEVENALSGLPNIEYPETENTTETEN